MEAEIKDIQESKGRRSIAGKPLASYHRPKTTSFLIYRSYLERKPSNVRGLCLTANYLTRYECVPNKTKENEWELVDTPKPEINDLDEEKRLYEAKKEFYLNRYEGMFVAIRNEEVLDKDFDFSKLAKRVIQNFGYDPIFIPLVTRRVAKAISHKKDKNTSY